MDAFDEFVRQTEPLPADGGELKECEDVPKLESSAEGTLGGRHRTSEMESDTLNDYWLENPYVYAGRWWHPVYREVMVLAFTDDAEAHREAIQARLPSRVIIIDVVKAEFSLAQLRATQIHYHRQFDQDDGLDGSSTSVSRNRVELYFVDPPGGVLERLAEIAPTAALCVNVYYPPEPPNGPLEVIPDQEDGDLLVTCRGFPPVPYSRLMDPPSIDEFDHPAVDMLRIEINDPKPDPLPAGDWVVIKIDEDNAKFAAIDSGRWGSASFRRIGVHWRLRGWSDGGPCEPIVPLPEGLGRVVVNLDPDALPNPENSAIQLLVTEAGCANGRTMGDALVGPQVVENDEAVLVAYAVLPVNGTVTCPGNPSTTVTIELSEPLGQRVLSDGLRVPPEPLTVQEDW